MGTGPQNTGNDVQRRGLPPYQNKAVRHNIGTTQGVAGRGLNQVQGISAPAGVGPNSQGLNSQAPQFPLLNPGVYGQRPPGLNPQTGLPYGNGAATTGATPAAGVGNMMSGTPAQGLPTQGGGPANVGNMGNQYAENVLSGQYLNPNSNPYERGAMNSADQATIQNYMTAIAPSTNAEFAMAGNFGGSSMMDAQANNEYQLANALGNINTNIANNAYNQGINQQEQLISQLPTVQQAQYTPAEAPLQYQNQANAGLMSLINPVYGYQQGWNTLPGDQFTAGQGVGAGLGLAGLATYP